MIGTDGQELVVGGVRIRLIHTPGHTMESTCYLLIDEDGKERSIFTGDTLFIGDVGRPDLAQHVIADLTEDKLAGLLYDSLRNKIMPLSDDLIVYPNHGAGSACGKMMSKETSDTLGHQKRTNYALRPGMTKEEFKKELLHGLMPPPGYFPQNVLMNKTGYEPLTSVMERGRKALAPDEFETAANTTGALVIDCRSARDFAKGFIPNSINFGLDGSFAMWVGEMVPDLKQPLLLVADPGKEEEAIIRLSRIGHDALLGHLKGGFEAWKVAGKEMDTIERITAAEFNAGNSDKSLVIDVRRKSEFDSEHVVGAVNIPLNELNRHLAEIPKDKPFILHCAGGYRSMVAASMLKARGWANFKDVSDGFAGIRKTPAPLTDFVQPTTML